MDVKKWTELENVRIYYDFYMPKNKPEVLEAMEEAKRISKDPNTKRYSSFSDAFEDID